MATLVLTAVGGAIGGPIGAALGGLIGQGADRALLGAKGRRGPRLSDLAVQTSRYGTAIPRLYGTMRVAGTVIWSTDLIERTSREGGGKGRGSTTTYSYSASFAVALSSRPIRRVARIWSDGKLLRGAAGDWKSGVAGFRVHAGGEDQPADLLIASAVADAPAHRGCAYAVFEGLELAGFGNRIPSLTFEVVADDAPVPIGRIARDLSAGRIAGEVEEALPGFAADGDSMAGAAQVLADLCGGWFTPLAGGRMGLRDRLPGPATAIAADAHVHATRRPIDTVPAALTLSYYEAARDYQVAVQRARRPGAGWREDAVEAPAVLDAAGAKRATTAMLLRQEAACARRRVVTDASALALAPGAGVTLPDGSAWRVARAEAEAMRVTLDLAPATRPPVVTRADAGTPVREVDAPVGATMLHAFELPAAAEDGGGVPQLTVAAAGASPAWRPAALLVSRDGGATWEPAGSTAAAATMGVLLAPLPRGPATLEDRAAQVEVALLDDAMTLSPATGRAMDGGANMALVGDEVLQFRDARQIAPRRWRLGGLWRARRGSDAADHAMGDRFVLLEPARLAGVRLPDARPGDRLLVMPQGVGDVEPAAAPVTVTGASIVPLAPVAVRADVAADGALVVAWTRRSRRGWRWDDGVDAPLGEERERYRVRIAGPAATREWTVDTPVLHVGPDERPAGTLTIAVAQVGTWGVSAPTRIIVEGNGI